jgi:hypothetical protein
VFITTPEFLPQHRAQREQTLQLMTAAEAHGQQRLAEANRTVLTNLDTSITTLETDKQEPTEDAL